MDKKFEAEIHKHFAAWLKADRSNLEEMFERVVMDWAYNYANQSGDSPEASRIYELCQSYHARSANGLS